MCETYLLSQFSFSDVLELVDLNITFRETGNDLE